MQCDVLVVNIFIPKNYCAFQISSECLRENPKFTNTLTTIVVTLHAT